MNNLNEQLLPCPFCGGMGELIEASDRKHLQADIFYISHGCRAMYSGWDAKRYSTKEAAYTAWNTRAGQSIQAGVDVVERAFYEGYNRGAEDGYYRAKGDNERPTSYQHWLNSRARLSAINGQEWLPIDKAYDNGKLQLFWSELMQRPYIALFDNASRTPIFASNEDMEFTHFMHLPTPPKKD